MTSERLANIYEILGIKFDSSIKPSANCLLISHGFCSGKGECYTHSVLDNQAEAGGINDKRLENAADQMVTTAIANGCNMFTKQ